MYNGNHHIQQHKRKNGPCANYKFVTGETTEIPPKYNKATTEKFYLFYFSGIYILWQPIQLIACMWCTAAITSYRRKFPWNTLQVCVFKIHVLAFRCVRKLQKKTIRFFISACLSTGNISIHTKRIFIQFNIGLFFETLSRKFKFR
jgi:hypothetical protein